ncbi:MAG: hypothetical protein JWO38_1580 [Gemmataceae bacterium]|nr:hypothetical protein [Gemmataceae bacterium]
MKTFVMLTLGLVVCAAVSGRAADKKPADAPKIAGEYSLVSGKKAGEAVDEMSKKAKYTIDEKKITIVAGDVKFVMSYKLDASATPTKIDMEMLEAPIADLKGSKAYGILEAKGDSLKLAYTLDKDKRAKDFAGKEGFVFELKKENPKDK